MLPSHCGKKHNPKATPYSFDGCVLCCDIKNYGKKPALSGWAEGRITEPVKLFTVGKHSSTCREVSQQLSLWKHEDLLHLRGLIDGLLSRDLTCDGRAMGPLNPIFKIRRYLTDYADLAKRLTRLHRRQSDDHENIICELQQLYSELLEREREGQTAEHSDLGMTGGRTAEQLSTQTGFYSPLHTPLAGHNTQLHSPSPQKHNTHCSEGECKAAESVTLSVETTALANSTVHPSQTKWQPKSLSEQTTSVDDCDNTVEHSLLQQSASPNNTQVCLQQLLSPSVPRSQHDTNTGSNSSEAASSYEPITPPLTETKTCSAVSPQARTPGRGATCPSCPGLASREQPSCTSNDNNSSAWPVDTVPQWPRVSSSALLQSPREVCVHHQAPTTPLELNLPTGKLWLHYGETAGNGGVISVTTQSPAAL